MNTIPYIEVLKFIRDTEVGPSSGTSASTSRKTATSKAKDDAVAKAAVLQAKLKYIDCKGKNKG